MTFFSGDNVRTIEDNVVLNFDVASFSNFRDIAKQSFPGGGGGGHRR